MKISNPNLYNSCFEQLKPYDQCLSNNKVENELEIKEEKGTYFYYLENFIISMRKLLFYRKEIIIKKIYLFY